MSSREEHLEKWRKKVGEICLYSLLACVATLVVPASADEWTGPDRPIIRKRLGSYIWHVERNFKKEREWALLRDRHGKLVLKVTSDHRILFDIYKDITGDGVPELVFHTWTGGAHGSHVYYIYSLGKTPRCLLIYDKGNICDEEDFDLIDLNGDGSKEIVSWYDGFAYWNASYAGSARVPIVLGYRNGRYVEETQRYPARLRQARARTEKWMRASLKQTADEAHSRIAPIAEWYALSLLLDGPTTAQRQLLRKLPWKDHTQFKAHRREIERILRERNSRYYYPRPYPHEVSPKVIPYWGKNEAVSQS